MEGIRRHKTDAGSAGTDKRSWRAELSDAGLFSYAALCAITLHDLYSDTPVNKPFQNECLSTLLVQLQLAQTRQVTSSVRALMDGQGSSDVSAFIDLLRAERVVERIGLQQVPEDLVTVGIKDGCYDARIRVLIRRITTLLTLDWNEVEDFERSLISTIKANPHHMSEEEQKEKESSALKKKVKKYTMIGLATVGGGALLGLTGGLAAPFLAAGAGAIIGGAGAAALGSVAGVAIIGSLFGVAGAGLGGFKMNKRVGDIEEFVFETLCEEGDLHVTIAISGWITDNEPDFKSPWANLSHSRDQFSLRYESEHLKNMGAAMDYMLTFAISAATQETLKYTVLSGLLAAVAWPITLLSASSIIDNPWNVCTHRTAAAGKQLAEVLLAREQGKRPVTLVGFSLGARVVFYCLTELAKRKNCEGIVQDAVMLGAPVTGSASYWAPFSRVVAGRIVNGYCKGDWLLRFLYRTASIQFSIAGLQPIKWKNRRMCNVDLSDIVTGHLDYWNKIDTILSVVGIRTVMSDAGVLGIPAMENMDTGDDQWLVVEDMRKQPSSGIASEVTTPSSSQATDPFPGCASPLRHVGQGHGSVSTDSGFDREAELENLCSATEGLSLHGTGDSPSLTAVNLRENQNLLCTSERSDRSISPQQRNISVYSERGGSTERSPSSQRKDPLRPSSRLLETETTDLDQLLDEGEALNLRYSETRKGRSLPGSDMACSKYSEDTASEWDQSQMSDSHDPEYTMEERGQSPHRRAIQNSRYVEYRTTERSHSRDRDSCGGRSQYSEYRTERRSVSPKYTDNPYMPDNAKAEKHRSPNWRANENIQYSEQLPFERQRSARSRDDEQYLDSTNPESDYSSTFRTVPDFQDSDEYAYFDHSDSPTNVLYSDSIGAQDRVQSLHKREVKNS